MRALLQKDQRTHHWDWKEEVRIDQYFEFEDDYMEMGTLDDLVDGGIQGWEEAKDAQFAVKKYTLCQYTSHHKALESVAWRFDEP